MSIDVALSTRRGVGRDTYSLPKKIAATPRVARQWVRPRSSAMSIDVALSTRRGVGSDTYSLPQKRGYAASGTSMDMPPLHKRHLFFAEKTRLRREWHVNG